MAPLLSTIAGLSLASVALCSASTPCSKVGIYLQNANQTDANEKPRVPAQLAYDCITSVPFNQSAAIKLIDGMKLYFQWHSTTSWLANPPQEYAEKVQPATDIWARLEEVRNKALAGSYKNEFEFGTELRDIPRQAHDAHFYYDPDVVGSIFSWGRPVPIVSVSSDGRVLPQPYVYEDILEESLGNITTWKPSHITHINGQEAIKFLEMESLKNEFQDRDALYNSMFYNLPYVAVGLGSYSNRFAQTPQDYPGADTSLTFANGTSRKYENYAEVLVSFDSITDGKVLYQTYFTGIPPDRSQIEVGNSTSPSSTPSSSPSPSPEPSAAPTPQPKLAPGYPPPIFRSPYNYVGGYYLDGEYSDVAVLSIIFFWTPRFFVDGFSGPIAKFLADAKRDGKKKLVLDLQSNLGGLIGSGLDLYKILFPKLSDHSCNYRYRAFESTKILTEKFTEASAKIPFDYDPSNDTLFDLQNNIATQVFNALFNVNETGNTFTSWEEQYGPYEIRSEEWSNLIRKDLNSSLITMFNTGVPMHGYGVLANYTETPFASEDIVVITDSACTSMCHTFIDLLKYRTGVKVVALGGRPQEGMIQALGSTKGGLFLSWSYIQQLVQLAITNLTSSPEEAARLNQTELGKYWDNTVLDRLATGSGGGVNFQNSIRVGDKTETPRQFVYEPADCRILFTKQMTYDMTAVWESVIDSAWREKNHCVAGNIASGSSLYRREDTAKSARNTLIAGWRDSLKVSNYPLKITTEPVSKRLREDGHLFFPV